MNLLTYFLPNFFATSVLKIEADFLLSHHVNVVLLDIDNTIIDPYLDTLSEEMKHHLATWQAAGITIFITSNSNFKRVAYIAMQLGVRFMHHTGKPSTSKFKRFLAKEPMNLSSMMVIGDQLLTDSWFAHKLGIQVIVVEPLVAHDLIKTRLNRLIDRRLRYYYRQKNIYKAIGGSSHE